MGNNKNPRKYICRNCRERVVEDYSPYPGDIELYEMWIENWERDE